MRSEKSACSEAGFSLIEVLVSVGLLSAMAIGVAQLFGVAIASNFSAKGQTTTSILASQKMEQLRGLTWGFDTTPGALGLPVSDTSSDLSQDPPNNTGSGLNPSPADTLWESTNGYVDYLDMNGTWVGTGTVAPTGTAYVRRWSVEPLPTNPNNTLILQVRVVPLRIDRRRVANDRRRLIDESWLVSVKTRKAP